MNEVVRRCVTSCMAALLCVTLGTAQTPQAPASGSDFQLRVGGEVDREFKLSLAELARLPHSSVKAKDHSGAESTFDGVALINILQLAGVKCGDGLRGKSLALYLVVEASDGYRAVFALPELDPATMIASFSSPTGGMAPGSAPRRGRFASLFPVKRDRRDG